MKIFEVKRGDSVIIDGIYPTLPGGEHVLGHNEGGFYVIDGHGDRLYLPVDDAGDLEGVLYHAAH